MGAGALPRHHAGRDGGPERKGGPLHAQRCAGGRNHQVHLPGEVGHARPAVLRLLRAGRDARAASRAEGVDRQVQGAVRPGLGQVPGGGLCATEGPRRHSAGHQADAAAGRDPRLGFTERRPEARRHPADGSLCRLHRPDRLRGRPRSRRAASKSGRPTTRSSSGRSATTARRWKARSTASSTR